MWLLLVTTVATVICTDADYLYNAHNAPVSPSSNYLVYNYVRYNYNKEEGIRNNVYLKKDNIRNNNAFDHQLATKYSNLQVHGNPVYNRIQRESVNYHNMQSYDTGHLSNGYSGNKETFKPIINFSNHAHSKWQHPASSISSVTNSNLNVPVITGNINSFAPSQGLNQYPQYTQTITAPGNNNYNNVYSQAYIPSAPVLQNIYGQPFIPAGVYNLKNSYINTTSTGSYSNGYSHILKPQASISLSSGYNQAAQTSVSLNNAYRPIVTSSVKDNFDSGYSHSFTASSPLSQSINGYIESPPSLLSNHLNNGHGDSLTPPNAINLNNGYDQSVASITSSASLNSDYRQSSTSDGTNVNSGLLPYKTPNGGSSSKNDYYPSSTAPTHIGLNSNLQFSSSSPTTLQSSNFNDVLVQTSFTEVVNDKAPNTVSSNLKGNPIVHKHIYLHVPPPEVEENIIPPSLPPKKNYKILFIKVPSQESKTKQIRLQNQVRNAVIEDKTIIYVLVKKPEDPEPVVLPEQKPSHHQVFFVKYNESPFDIAARVYDELDRTGTINSIVPLEPGLINGRQR